MRNLKTIQGGRSRPLDAVAAAWRYARAVDRQAAVRYDTRRRAVDLYVLTSAWLTVAVMTYGACVQQLWAPGRDGRRANVVLGFPTLDGYVASGGHYFGATVGRFANRIARRDVHARRRRLPAAAERRPELLHGGTTGFDRRVWEAAVVSPVRDRAGLELRYTSPDGEMGYPGHAVGHRHLHTRAQRALLDRLPGGDGRSDDRQPDEPHVLEPRGRGHGGRSTTTCSTLAADPLHAGRRSTLVPTGELAPVAGTPFDFTKPMPIGARIRDADSPAARDRTAATTTTSRSPPAATSTSLVQAARVDRADERAACSRSPRPSPASSSTRGTSSTERSSGRAGRAYRQKRLLGTQDPALPGLAEPP